MKAVNVAENSAGESQLNTLEYYREVGVKCGEAQRKRDQGTVSHLMNWFHKATRLEGELSKKLATDAFTKGYREGTGYSQQQKPQYFREKVGFDGKYIDDMESGVAVKKLHNLDESNKQKFVYPENFKQVRNYIRIVRRPETNEFVVTWYENGRLNEDKSYFTDDIKDAWDTFNHMKSQVDKANNPNLNNGVNEETGTGAVAGYQTPFAFSKNKQGSSRAIASAKKYGKVVKSISEKKK